MWVKSPLGLVLYQCYFNMLTINKTYLILHWGKADDRNYGHSKMADVESGKNFFVD